MKTKICTHCKTEKLLSEFQKYKYGKYGHHRHCKFCASILKAKDYKDKWFVYLNRLKKSECKRKGLSFNLTIDYLKSIWTDTCPVFNKSFEKHDKTSPWCPTLDRINPAKGYIEGNVCFISSRANRIKYDATIQELLDVVDYMKQYE